MADKASDSAFMQQALALAAEAAQAGEVPVGAVLVHNGEVIGRGRNRPIESADPTAHAEIGALREAAQNLGNYRLEDCTLYVTLEPCAMCCGAILNARVRRVVYAATEGKTGCAGSVLNLFDHSKLNHHSCVEGGLLSADSTALLQAFFQSRREQQRQRVEPLREDALRPATEWFQGLPDFPWKSHFLSDLPTLEGLRMHYLAEGPQASADTRVLLHGIPGWSYLHRGAIARAVEEGARVIVPDLIGFGKSDQPKREDAHTAAFHVNCLLQLMDRLHVQGARLQVLPSIRWLGQALLNAASPAFSTLEVLTEEDQNAVDSLALNAPYPNRGHRAGERAFLSFGGVP
mgnify:FL=1